MKGYVAIFYDIENLLKGYNSSQNFISSISLKNIFNQIKNIEQVERISVQRAYANWSDPRLSVMKGEINDIGIDPIQIFGFSRNQKKNAADIQLAVDAIDLAHVRTSIEIFVIVSGDGGFSALAKKLHEYGKYVIGCAYKSSTNRIFESVCDVFIGIDEPEEIETEKKEFETSLKITNPKVLRMSTKIERISTKDKNQIINKSQEIIRWFIKDYESAKELATVGIHLSVVREAFKYAIEDFQTSAIGFSKFVEFLQFICCDTEVKLLTSSNYEAKIAFRNSKIKGFEDLPDKSQDYLHSIENYQSILVSGSPRLKIISPQDFKDISISISSLLDKQYNLDILLEYLNEIHTDIESEIINSSLFSMINADIFIREPLDNQLSEQTLILKSEYSNPDLIIKKIKEDMYKKLSSFWGEAFREDIFLKMISDM